MLSTIIEYLETEDFTFKCEYECPQYKLTIEVGDAKNSELHVFNSPSDENDVDHNVTFNGKVLISSPDVKEVINVIQTTSDVIYYMNKPNVVPIDLADEFQKNKRNMYDFITERLEDEISHLFTEFHEKYNTKGGDIYPEQQHNLDRYTEVIAQIMYEQIKQNL
jgi:hypothetical protein